METYDLQLTLSDTTPDYNQSSYEDYNTYFTCVTERDILKKTSLTLYSIIFALGTIGNGLVIWIAGFRMKKTVSAVWFLNLAVADFLCCASLPLRIVDWIYNNSFLSDICCILSIILFTLNMSASVLLLAAMSIDRCVSVMWPFWAKVHRTRKLVRITAVIIWVLSLLLTGLLFVLYGFYLYDVAEWCVFYSYNCSHVYFFKTKQTIPLTRLVIMFVIPFLVILISYVTIFFKIRNSKSPQRSQRPYRIITAVVLCFFICWFPYYIWPLIPMYDGSYIIINMLHIIILNLACLNSCINPIIYVFMGQDFKHGFLRSIPSRLERALNEQPHDVCKEGEDFQYTCTTGV